MMEEWLEQHSLNGRNRAAPRCNYITPHLQKFVSILLPALITKLEPDIMEQDGLEDKSLWESIKDTLVASAGL